ncbi:MAG: Tim44-like domain-containing protein [Verrucomicrobiota bacterium]|jgi:hypothetical protein
MPFHCQALQILKPTSQPAHFSCFQEPGRLDRRRRRPADGIFRHKLTHPFGESSSRSLMIGARADHYRLHRKPAPALAFVILFALTCPPEVFARAGGGGNSGLGTWMMILLLPFLIIYAWYVNKRINEKKELTEQAITRMAASDPAWDERKLEAFVREDFFVIEKAWCDFDYATLQTRMEEGLFATWQKQLEAMASLGQRNVMEDLLLNEVRFVEAKDYQEKDRDEFTVCLDASAVDYTIDAAGKIVESNTSSRRAKANKEKRENSFREFWTYHRHGQVWKLAVIDQSAGWSKAVDAPIVEEGVRKRS